VQTSARRHSKRLGIAVAITLFTVTPTTGAARIGGFIRHATRISDAIELKRTYDARNRLSNVVRTWEISYVFNGADNTRVFVRTFAEPGMGIHREKMRHEVCLPHVREESANELAQLTLAAHRSGAMVSGAPLPMIRYPMAV